MDPSESLPHQKDRINQILLTQEKNQENVDASSCILYKHSLPFKPTNPSESKNKYNKGKKSNQPFLAFLLKPRLSLYMC